MRSHTGGPVLDAIVFIVGVFVGMLWHYLMLRAVKRHLRWDGQYDSNNNRNNAGTGNE